MLTLAFALNFSVAAVAVGPCGVSRETHWQQNTNADDDDDINCDCDFRRKLLIALRRESANTRCIVFAESAAPPLRERMNKLINALDYALLCWRGDTRPELIDSIGPHAPAVRDDSVACDKCTLRDKDEGNLQVTANANANTSNPIGRASPNEAPSMPIVAENHRLELAAARCALVERRQEARTADVERTIGVLQRRRHQAQLEAGNGLFVPLGEAAERRIKRALGGSGTETIVTAYRVGITGRDIKTLAPGCWLNDEVINIYGSMVQEFVKPRKAYCFSSFFYGAVAQSGHARVASWTRRIDLFDFDVVFFPVHHPAHWCCGAVDFTRQRIEYYDSLHGSSSGFFQVMRGYLDAEYLIRKGSAFDFSDWSDHYEPENIPRQLNPYDCGVFTCVFMYHLGQGLEMKFGQQHMKYWRRRLIYEIATQKMLG